MISLFRNLALSMAIASAVLVTAPSASAATLTDANSDQDALRVYRNSLGPKVAFDGLLRVTGRELALEVEVKRLEGMTRYFFHDDGRVTEILRGDGRMIARGNSPGMVSGIPLFLDLVDTTDLIQQNYTVSFAGREVIGGRPARKIEITPRKAGRPYRVVWIDEATGIQLRREDYRYDGGLIERRELLRLTVDKTPDQVEARRWKDILRDPRRGDYFLVVPGMPGGGHGDMKKPPAGAITPSWVPEGYRFVGERSSGFGHGGVIHLIWTDGIGIISVFERPVPWWARRPQGLTQRSDGGVEWESGGVRFLLIGDAAPEELLAMAASFGGKD